MKKLLLLLSLILLIMGLSAPVSKASSIFTDSFTYNLVPEHNTPPLFSWVHIDLLQEFYEPVSQPMIDTTVPETQTGLFEKKFIMDGFVAYEYYSPALVLSEPVTINGSITFLTQVAMYNLADNNEIDNKVFSDIGLTATLQVDNEVITAYAAPDPASLYDPYGSFVWNNYNSTYFGLNISHNWEKEISLTWKEGIDGNPYTEGFLTVPFELTYTLSGTVSEFPFPVPVPRALLLLGAGLVRLAIYRRRKLHP
jgi:hypothetical protein